MHCSLRILAAAIFLSGFLLASACSSSSTSTQGPAQTIAPQQDNMLDVRYCEMLLVSLATGQPVATVYNTYPVNLCPADKWTALDPKAIAAQYGATVAMLNGPRHWMINHVEKVGEPSSEKADFGGIEMYKQATVPIGSLLDQSKPYSVYPVSRSVIFTWLAGTEIFELTGPDGAHYIMQSFSQQKDPSLTLATLPTLRSKLALPTGWIFSSRTLTNDFQLATVKNPAQVMQDDLGNSYSMIPTTLEN
ncbi:MAG: hypothetical protein QNL59_03035 [Actinomycetota bacterium]